MSEISPTENSGLAVVSGTEKIMAARLSDGIIYYLNLSDITAGFATSAALNTEVNTVQSNLNNYIDKSPGGYYGPYNTLAAAASAVPNTVNDGVSLRKGKVVGINSIDGIIDYWWKLGVTDDDLVFKNVDTVLSYDAIFEKTLTITGGGTTTTALSTNYNWVQDEVFIPAGKKLNSLNFGAATTTEFNINLYSKSGTTFTVADIINVTPVIGQNSVVINKTYPTDIYIGPAKGGSFYYSQVIGKVVSLGQNALTVGSTTESGIIQQYRMNFSAVYVNSIISIPVLEGRVSANEADITSNTNNLISVTDLLKPDLYTDLDITDEDGNVALKLRGADGTLLLKSLIADALQVNSFSATSLLTSSLDFSTVVVQTNGYPYELAITDEAGNIAFATKNGQVISVGSTGTATTATEIPNIDSDIVHEISYGQSLSIGHGSTPISLVQPYNALMFAGGVRTWQGATITSPPDPATKYNSLVPLVESIGETPCSGFAQMTMERLIEEYKFDGTLKQFQLIASSPGIGGANIESLKKGANTSYYANVLSDVSAALARANELGKTYSVGCLIWTQGEANTSSNMPTDAYVLLLKQLLVDFNTDIRAITKQPNDVQFVMYQVASQNQTNTTTLYPNIGLAHAKVCEDVSNAHLGVPAYIFDYSDNLHLTASSYKWMGAYHAYAYKKAAIDKEGSYSPLNIKSVLWQKNMIELKLNVPVGPLVFDTDFITDPGNKGFSITDASGVMIPITSLTLVRDDSIRITAGNDLVSGYHVRYGINGTSGKSGRIAGARGNLRDSQGDTLFFDKKGLNLPMHNWCLIFDKTLS